MSKISSNSYDTKNCPLLSLICLASPGLRISSLLLLDLPLLSVLLHPGLDPPPVRVLVEGATDGEAGVVLVMLALLVTRGARSAGGELVSQEEYEHRLYYRGHTHCLYRLENYNNDQYIFCNMSR